LQIIDNIDIIHKQYLLAISSVGT